MFQLRLHCKYSLSCVKSPVLTSTRRFDTYSIHELSAHIFHLISTSTLRKTRYRKNIPTVNHMYKYKIAFNS